MYEKFQDHHWEIRVPIFKDSLILKQLSIAIGIPFGLIMLVLAFTANNARDTFYGVFSIMLLLFLTWLFVMIFYKGSYDVECFVTKDGVRVRYQEKQAKKNKIVNGLTFFLGLFSRNYTAAGAGALAHARQDVFIRWKNIRKVTYTPKQRRIYLKAGFQENIALYCLEENYQDIQAIVEARAKGIKS